MALPWILAALALLSHTPSGLQADGNSLDESLKQQVTNLLKAMLCSFKSTDVPDPRILIALRLADQHSLAIERDMMQGLKEDAVHRVQNDLSFTTGTVALYVMALQASCQNASDVSALGATINLLQLLEDKLQEEVDNMDMVDLEVQLNLGYSPDEQHQPLTNFYQFSLGVLALCLQDADIDVNTTYLDRIACSPEQRMTELSVDAGALAVMYLTCKQHSVDEEQKMMLQNKIDCIMGTMLWEETENATIGNIYSTGIALQAVHVAGQYINTSRWKTAAIRAAVSQAISKGRFDNPLAAAEITTALMGLTYLNVRDRNCVTDQDNLPLDCCLLPTPDPSLRMINVSFTAYDDIGHTFNFSIDLRVPQGSTHLDVMEIAQIYRPDEFSFTTGFSYRVFILSINGLYSKFSDMSYNQIWDMQHLEGLDTYVVSDGEQLVARFTLS